MDAEYLEYEIGEKLKSFNFAYEFKDKDIAENFLKCGLMELECLASEYVKNPGKYVLILSIHNIK
jgi:hypothetical protein